MQELGFVRILLAFTSLGVTVIGFGVAAVYKFTQDLRDRLDDMDQRYQDLLERVARLEAHVEHLDHSPPERP